MTNCAPLFGVPFGQAYITASANYFDVVLYHSVVMWNRLVYGLMVWLPAHWAPPAALARVPRWWVYPIAVVAPFLFLPLLVVLAPWLWLTPKHPPIHF